MIEPYVCVYLVSAISCSTDNLLYISGEPIRPPEAKSKGGN